MGFTLFCISCLPNVSVGSIPSPCFVPYSSAFSPLVLVPFSFLSVFSFLILDLSFTFLGSVLVFRPSSIPRFGHHI